MSLYHSNVAKKAFESALQYFKQHGISGDIAKHTQEAINTLEDEQPLPEALINNLKSRYNALIKPSMSFPQIGLSRVQRALNRTKEFHQSTSNANAISNTMAPQQKKYIPRYKISDAFNNRQSFTQNENIFKPALAYFERNKIGGILYDIIQKQDQSKNNEQLPEGLLYSLKIEINKRKSTLLTHGQEFLKIAIQHIETALEKINTIEMEKTATLMARIDISELEGQTAAL